MQIGVEVIGGFRSAFRRGRGAQDGVFGRLRAKRMLAVLGVLVFFAVQPIYFSPSELAAALKSPRYWIALGLLKLVGGALGLGLARVATGETDVTGLRRDLDRRQAFWAIGFWVLALPAIKFILTLSEPEPLQRPAEVLRDADQVFLRISMAFALIVATPLCEEIAFRGLIQQGIRRVSGAGPAIFLTSLIFMVVHEPRSIWPAVFVLSLVLGRIYERTRSIWPGVLVHAVHNALVFVLIVRSD